MSNFIMSDLWPGRLNLASYIRSLHGGAFCLTFSTTRVSSRIVARYRLRRFQILRIDTFRLFFECGALAVRIHAERVSLHGG